MKSIFVTAAIAAMILLTISCQNDEKAKRMIVKPLKDVSINPNVFRINPSRDTVIMVPGGSIIRIPANSLADMDGNLVTEAVDLSYTEFKDPSAIILSGIPMIYDSAGTENYFRSAGMFDIRATMTNKQEVKIAEGKNIEVSMASDYEDGEQPFNFYQFDTAAGQWNYMATAPAAPNPAMNPEKPDTFSTPGQASVKVQSRVKTSNEFVFDFKVDYSAIPELKGFAEIMWKYSGNKKYPNPEKEQWIFTEDWTTAKIENDPSAAGRYLMVLKNANRSFTTSVLAVLPDGGDPNAMTNVQQRVNALNSASDSLAAIGEAAIQEGRLLRTFQISGFGVYNWDICNKFIKPIYCNIKYSIDGKPIDKNTSIFQVFAESNTVLNVMLNNKQNTVVPQDRFVIIALSSDGTAAVYRDCETLYTKASNSMELSVDLKNTGIIVKGHNDLAMVIG